MTASQSSDRWADLGEFIRQQRSTARLSLRRLSEIAGISNPYLSQIERGLRKPSAEILQQIAKALRISAETLYVRAGILEDDGGEDDLVRHILTDPHLVEEQRQALVRVYMSFRRENGPGEADPVPPRTGADAPADLTRQARSVGWPAMRRLAVLSMHTSPLAQPGTGDGGGMNVYVRELSSALARKGVTCDVYTRRWSLELPDVVMIEPGFAVHHVDAGPPCPVAKETLQDHVAEFTESVIEKMTDPRQAGVDGEAGAQAIHANYWLSGLAGHAIKHRLGLPLVSTFHTLDRVKAEASPEEVESAEPGRRAPGGVGDHRLLGRPLGVVLCRGRPARGAVRRRSDSSRGRPPRRRPCLLLARRPAHAASGARLGRRPARSCCSSAGSSP